MKINQLKMKKISFNKSIITDTLKSSIIALVITLLCVLIFGIILKFVDVPSNVIKPINQVIKIISLLTGCLIGFKNKSIGAIKGGLTGVIYTLLSMFIFLIIGVKLNQSFNWIDILFGMVIGVICGIISVNTGKRA